MHRPAVLARALFLLCVAAPLATAQIELPSTPVVTPAPTPPVELPELPRGDLIQKVTGKDPYADPKELGQEAKPAGGLELPPGPPAGQDPATLPAAAVPGRINSAPLENLPPGRKDAADFILAELRRLDDVHHAMVDQAAQSLIGLGDEGIDAARRGLLEDRPPTILACAKVLLSSSTAQDRELVRRRLNSKLPASVGGPLVEAFVSLDPVSASPVVLAALLDHPLVGVRAAVSRKLTGVHDAALLPALGGQLKSERADTRLRALELLANFEGESVVDQLLGRLKDPSAMVAGRAALLLAAREDPATVGLLRTRAFDQPWILRESAYAILSLIEREDARLLPCLDERHVPILLEGLASSDPFIAGSCAAALAGIGFRSTTLAGAEWIDRAVPERLVRCVSGLEFHNDFSSLQRPVCRRLALISGQAFASDGPAWMKWWSESRGSFRARRAVIEAGPELAGSLQLSWRNDLGELESFRILGPTVTGYASDSANPDSAEVFRITELQAHDVFAMLQETRVFTAERLPGVRGSSNLPGRSLEIGIGKQGKSFRFAGSTSEAWFETVAASLRAVRDRNRWQRYPAPKRHARAADLWFEQCTWWDGEHTEHERALRMKSLVLESLPAIPLERRSAAVTELIGIYADASNIEVSDFPVLLAMLREEPFYTPRARVLLGLTLVHLTAENAQQDGRLEILISLAIERFGEGAGEAMGRILHAAGPLNASASTHDVRPRLRAAAVREILETGAPADFARAVEMLRDPEVSVQVTAIDALGSKQVEAARVELLLRARLGDDPVIRSAALGAIANLGGEGVLDAMMLGLTSPVHAIKVAAARGLARIGDPAAAPLLVSLLGQGRGSDVFEAARQGLIAMGDGATSDLLRAVNTPGSRARREGALLLSQQGVPEAIPVLLALLSENPNDSLIAGELAVSTCIDLRASGNPSVAWWDWWEGVVHNDAAAWLCGALERLGVSAPAPAELASPGTRQGLRFLTLVMRRSEAHLVERARRDLGRLLGRELGALPVPGDDRNLFIADLEREISKRFPQ